ncbi:glycoside hydrolase family 13 protein [Mixia osmundae IAM 14324]|uniref:Glycogen debranching enzyme n=1 Tax=Mixia osmundae (strain CBS 9802 / IAM 14324 / JCM 22182 / KY 12970) TaxID=764103 RepID=G7DTR3_MIXOS|nr:glycoside hydrolase family 13 protein [Mixia osmundae IAM 14324]KEI41689.1 glycoside hydrolase family 13 protein [Mixia osmundae IAM 14324]GAA93973.1 hypothetical protein E5Q_00620 [Mixia osmundae IAM 14324]
MEGSEAAQKLAQTPSETALTVWELILEDDGSPSKERKYVRLPAPVQPYVLRVSMEAGATASKAGVLHTNFPLDGSAYDRKRFHSIDLPKDLSKPIHIDLPITSAGVFEYYLEYDSSSILPASDQLAKSSDQSTFKDRATRIKSQPGYFNVDPTMSVPARTPILERDTFKPLPVGKGGKVLSESVSISLDGLAIQTLIAKWMGSLDKWAPHLDVTRDRGYNMIHFTPLQQRGESRSPYSIFDQLLFDDELFTDAKLSKEDRQTEIAKMLARIRKEWGMLSLIDVVLNHTANNSDWLLDHPEAAYNGVNSPHLEAAIELDKALIKFSDELESVYRLSPVIESESDLARIVDLIKNKVLPELALWQYYVINVKASKTEFEQAWADGGAIVKPAGVLEAGRQTDRDREVPDLAASADLGKLSRAELAEAFSSFCLPKRWRQLSSRYSAKVDVASAIKFLQVSLSIKAGPDTAKQATEELGHLLDELNVDQYKLFDDDVKAILSNIRGRATFMRLEANGPKMGKITPKARLCEPLFTYQPQTSRTKQHDPRALVMANNGWMWGADPLSDFASSGSRAYLRREIIAWGDCVKLRYGNGPEDSPWLWKHMTAYAELLAGMFDGFRIDNCHSTPLHVGEYVLDAARKINPNLYVVAELFTGSQETDVIFVSRLGLNSLIREAMNGNDPKDQSSLMYSYGVQKPIGSMDSDCLTEEGLVTVNGTTRKAFIMPHAGSSPHAVMMDCTHDNDAPAQKRTAVDALPTGALSAFCSSGVGSTKGFDDLYPKLLNLVTDTRSYEAYDNPSNGIGAVKRIVNHLHIEMSVNGFSEAHISQEGNYITAHRVNPQTHDGYLLVAYTAFNASTKGRGDPAPITLRGTRMDFIAGYGLKIAGEDPADKKILKGLPAELIALTAPKVQGLTDEAGFYAELTIPDDFAPGSVLIFATSMPNLDAKLDALCLSGDKKAFAELDEVDLNVVMYRADGEERDATGGNDGVYTVPGMSALTYCGVEGWMHPLRYIMQHNDLGHPLCDHLRKGTWAFGYVWQRLERQVDVQPRLKAVAAWYKERLDAVSAKAPAFLRPRYFAMINNVASKAAKARALEIFDPFVKTGPQFTQDLALTALQMLGRVRSASMDPGKETASLAAGLPHFAASWARAWGRDQGIAIRGLLITTGLHSAARLHLIALCSTIRFGLIPNLIDSIRTPRYNSRDSPWWVMQLLQDYTILSKEGNAFLQAPVKRRFPEDGEYVEWNDPKAYSRTSTVAECVHEILQAHASGIHFREHNAGSKIDEHMKEDGFNIDIDTDWSTGFTYGGNAHNCGTWQDKNGSSEKAGNRGMPGTPRDGAPVEIIGLLKSTLRWAAELSREGLFPATGVKVTIDGKAREITYAAWSDLIQKSFERCFYVPVDPSKDGEYSLYTKLVARRGIYKDVYGTGKGRERADYQLRGQFPIAMAVAPELFEPLHALGALHTAHQVLLGPLGVRTLDPQDPDYRGDYDNANDSTDYHIAQGLNYHQGPEWVWPLGYFLRAYLHFDRLVGAGKEDANETIHHIHTLLREHKQEIRRSPWAGLPELTNANGAYCHDSCRTQAWSMSTLLDVLHDIYCL